MLSQVEHEKSFIALGLVVKICTISLELSMLQYE